MLTVPLQPIASQTVNVVLDGQACTINVYEKSTGLYMDLYVNAVLIIGGVICNNLDRIVRDLYFGFNGDFIWEDVQGSTNAPLNPPMDPYYQGIGSRFFLIYLEVADLGGLG